MKKIFTYIAAAFVLAACAHDNGFREAGQAGDFSFKLVSSQPGTKATIKGSTKENRVASIDYYFYADTTAAEVAHGRYIPQNPDAGSWTLSLTVGTGPLAGKTLNDLFPGGKDCIVFFVANLAEGDVPTGLSLVNLKKTAIEQTFASEDNKTVLHENDMANFYMTAQAKLSPDGTGDMAAKAIEVGLKRIAVKMDYDVRIVPSIEFNKGTGENAYREVWTPMLNDHNVRIYLENAVFNSVLGAGGEAGEVDGAMTYYLPETYTQQSYDPTFLTLNEALVDGKKQMTSQAFFTYPMRWEEGDAREPDVKLIVPWRIERYQEGITDPVYKTEREMYYKIMLPENVLDANDWFKMTIDVTILGSEAGDPEVVIPAQYTIINWITGAADGVNTDIVDAKYLSVDVVKREGANLPFQIYSVSGSTTYASSHKVNMEIVEIYQVNLTGSNRFLYQNGAVVTGNLQYFHTIDSETGEERALTADDVTGWVTHQENAGGGLVEVKHMLNNNMLSNYFDATEYVYTIKLTLSADASYTETIQFIQYPALYVKAYESAMSGVWLKNNQRTNDQVDIYDDAGSYIGRFGGSASSSNYNNISVSVSVLTGANTITYGGNTYQMVIGDPRGAAVNWSANLTGLTNYRPGGESTSNIVAPKFLVASSYGATYPMTYQQAQRRCAAYQENGYPAGRWRLPTMAEIQFLISLSEKGKIETLFNPTEDNCYWAAGQYGYNGDWVNFTNATFTQNTGYGASYPNGYRATINNKTYYVFTRCVYDEWYWAQYDEENDPNKMNDIDKLANPASWGGYQTTIPATLPIQN